MAVVTGGYRGDVLPFVPIARALVARGHEVRLLVPAEFHALLEDEPVQLPVVDGHVLGPLFLDQYAAFMGRWGTRLGGVRVPGFMLKVVADHLADVVDAMEPHAQWADVAVVHPVAALSAAMPFERRGVPWLVGDLFPMLLPSTATSAIGVRSLGPTLNRWSWQLGRLPMTDLVSHARVFKQMRRQLGLSVDGWNLVDGRSSPHLNLGLFSPHYVDVQPDWPQPYRVVGFTFWDAPPSYVLDPAISSFLDDDRPPVLVCLGTSAASARPDLFIAAARALEELGERGLFLTSTLDNGAAVAARDAGHGVWPFVPLDAVLGRCRAVVHSGAHGTNAMTLRAGLPSVVRPCLPDQAWHAHRQAELGTGVAVRGTNLQAALRRVLHDPAFAERAARLGTTIRAEDGAANAAEAIDHFLTGRP